MLNIVTTVLLALSTTTAIAAPADGTKPQICQTNYTATYDILPAAILTGSKVPGNTDGLSYLGVRVGDYETLNLASNPESPPNTLFFTKQMPKPHRIYRAKGTKSFNLNSLYLLCSGVDNLLLDVPFPCTVRAFGTKINGDVVAVNMDFGSGLLPLIGASMQRFSFPNRFSNLKHVEFTLVGPLLGLIKGVNFDNIDYTINAPC